MRKEPGELPETLEDTSENRQQQAVKVIEFLSRSGIADKLNSQEDKSDFVKELNIGEVESILERLNGIIVGTPIGQREIYTFPGMIVDSETGKPLRLPMNPSAQRNVLERVVVPGIKDLSPEDVPEVLATEINLLHMFQDGNGRLARAVYLLTRPDFKINESEDSVLTMGQYLTERQGSLNFDSSFIEEDLRKIVFLSSNSRDPRVLETHSLEIPSDTPDLDISKPAAENFNADDSHKEILTRIKYIFSVDPLDGLVAVREFLFARRKNPEDFLLPQGEGAAFSIDCKKLVDSISTREDYEYLLSSFDFPKTVRAQTILDMYKNPTAYPSKLPGVNLKTYYQFVINDNAMKDSGAGEQGLGQPRAEVNEAGEHSFAEIFPEISSVAGSEYPKYAQRLESVRLHRAEIDLPGPLAYDAISNSVLFKEGALHPGAKSSLADRIIYAHRLVHETLHAISFRKIEKYDGPDGDASIYTGLQHNTRLGKKEIKDRENINECLTNFFAFRILSNLPGTVGEKSAMKAYILTHDGDIAIAEAIVKKVGEDVLTAAYFDGDFKRLSTALSEKKIDPDRLFNLFKRGQAQEALKILSKK